MGNAFVGLDLGQAQDYTALLALDQFRPAPVVQPEPVVRGDGQMRYSQQRARVVLQPAHYECRHIERFPLGTAYPQVVDAVVARMRIPALRHAVIVVDGTGVGRPVVDLFRARGLRLAPVLITAGAQATYDEFGYWHVPKRELVSTVQILLQSDRLKIARALPEAQTLIQELLSFEAKITMVANDTYGEWRAGKHDDLVLALALALWYAERIRPVEVPPSSSIRDFRW
jgi:Terminase RNaseH-like domain